MGQVTLFFKVLQARKMGNARQWRKPGQSAGNRIRVDEGGAVSVMREEFRGKRCLSRPVRTGDNVDLRFFVHRAIIPPGPSSPLTGRHRR